MGLNATWDLLNCNTPAASFFARVVETVDRGFDLKHSTKHALPDDTLDVKGLGALYQKAAIFEYRPNRKRVKKTPSKDILSQGIHLMSHTKWLKDFYKRRRAYNNHFNTNENYSDEPTRPDEIADDEDFMDEDYMDYMDEDDVDVDDQGELDDVEIDGDEDADSQDGDYAEADWQFGFDDYVYNDN